MDKWTLCDHFLFIRGPGEVIVLYWVSDGPCYYVLYMLEFPIQIRLCPIFVKIMDPSKWDITVLYRATRYPRVFRRLKVGQQTLGFWSVTLWIPVNGTHDVGSSYTISTSFLHIDG